MIDAGASPHRIYTDFDPKFLEGEMARWFHEQRCKLRAAPSGSQNQNGLVERTWQTVVAMARSYVTDMQMPCVYWYWGIRHAIQISNSLPCTVNGILTTPFELVYGVKPDYRILFCLFSIGYFKHACDGS